MKDILILAGVLVAWGVLRKLAPFILRRAFGGAIGRAIGAHALAHQPDTIHLEKVDSTAWQEPKAVEPLASPLLQRGFRDAGVFRIAEMPGVRLQLLVKSDDSLIAAIYEHPQAGHWMDLAARYQDGSSITFTTSPPTGLVERPEHPILSMPALDAQALLTRTRVEMPKRPLQAVTPFTAPRVFEHAYAESMEFRKQRGTSAREVANVAEKMRKAA